MESFMDNGIHPPYRIFYSLGMGFCTKSAVRSIDVLNDVFEHVATAETPNPEEDVDVQSVLDELQNLVVQGAAVARYFWPIREGQEIHASRAQALRNRFSIREDNPLRVCKPLRDAMEHFDERLDKYLAKGVVGHIFPQYFGNEGKRDGVPLHFFRAYFIDSGTFEMLGERFEIEPIANELIRLNEQLGNIQ
jgi:hypothetical protein